ncbi:MAG TPA: 16S rRNA (guanine(527)-N(7))-methyltransferase RsmG [Devosiaceae bacterium]
MEAVAAIGPFERHLTRPVDAVAADLESFVLLLRKWQRIQNLVSRETLDEVWSRHIADSLQLLPLLKGRDRNIIDLGSGGGLPAIPVAIALKSTAITIHCIESNARKVSFLRTVARDLDLEVEVHAERAEHIDVAAVGQADIVMSRAMAPLSTLLALSFPLLRPGGRALLHKGKDFERELRESAVDFAFEVVVNTSLTDRSGVILQIENLKRRAEL